MKNVKDRMDDLMPVAEMNQLLDILKTTGATHIEVATVIGHPNFVSYSQQWANAIHAKGMKVTWRCAHWNMEGLYGQTKFVGENRTSTDFWINEAVNAFTLIASSIQAGDEEAIYPERTEGIFSDDTSFLDTAGLPGSYGDFFISLHDALSIFPWTVGMSSNNASELLSGWMPAALINYANRAIIDHYRDGDPALYETEVRQVNTNYGKPVYVQEGSPSRFVAPTRSEADAYYAVNQSMEDDGILTGFGAWAGWSGTPESIVDFVGGEYVLNDNGLSLQEWWGGVVVPPVEPPVEPPAEVPAITPIGSPRHQIIVKDKAGTVLGEISDWFNLKFSDQVNNYGQATFDIPIDSDDAVRLISLRRYEVEIVQNGVSVWSGEQANADVTVAANDANLITITCYTYPEMLNGRYTDDYIRFDQIDQAEILKQLVQISQAKEDGDFGFTFATIVPTKLRDREYRKDNIMECFFNMGNVIDGIDTWIDAKKVIHFGASRRGTDKSNQFGFEWGVNVQEMKISDNFSSPANTGYALGSSDGVNQLTGTYVDIQSRHTYKLREQTVSAIDVIESDTLEGKAQDLVNSNKNQRRTVRVTQLPNTIPSLEQLFIGDSINVRYKKGRYDINSAFRILGYECAIGKVGESNVVWILADYQGI